MRQRGLYLFDLRGPCFLYRCAPLFVELLPPTYTMLRQTSARLLTTSRRWLSTSSIETPLLLSPKQVQELSKSEQVALLDASWFMPNSPRNAKTEFLNKRLPGAQFLDLDEVASPHELGLKHMMPGTRVFAEACGKKLSWSASCRRLAFIVQEDLVFSPHLT